MIRLVGYYKDRLAICTRGPERNSRILDRNKTNWQFDYAKGVKQTCVLANLSFPRSRDWVTGFGRCHVKSSHVVSQLESSIGKQDT